MKPKHINLVTKDPSYRHQLFETHREDPYQIRKKWSEPTVCPNCGAVYHKGHWQWRDPPKNANRHRCPACARVRDRVPASSLLMKGEFFKRKKDEILRLADNLAMKEIVHHPLERVIDIERDDESITMYCTGVHLSRGLGEALKHAYQGELEIQYNERSGETRVIWER